MTIDNASYNAGIVAAQEYIEKQVRWVRCHCGCQMSRPAEGDEHLSTINLFPLQRGYG